MWSSGDYDTVITGDCHDNATLAEITYPGAPFSDSEDPRGDNGTFDWDCDGDDEEYEDDEPSEDCGGYFSSSCRAGWQGGNPGCGQTARLSTSCSNSGSPTVVSMEIQRPSGVNKIESRLQSKADFQFKIY